MSKKHKISDDYLTTLEVVKKQYQEYLEVSKIYELPTLKEKEPVQYKPPTPDSPLTTNTFQFK